MEVNRSLEPFLVAKAPRISLELLDNGVEPFARALVASVTTAVRMRARCFLTIRATFLTG